MNPLLQEKVQAWVDGQLDAAETREVAAQVERDPECRALADNLRSFSHLLRENPPARTVPDSREFYWNAIRRGIEQSERARARDATGDRSFASPIRWLAWFLPVGVAALAFALLFRPGTEVPSTPAAGAVPRLAHHEVEAGSDQITTLTFYASEEAMTVVWLGDVDLL